MSNGFLSKGQRKMLLFDILERHFEHKVCPHDKILGIFDIESNALLHISQRSSILYFFIDFDDII